MILIFDLDDTLYEERKFVESGFKAISHYLKIRFKIDEKKIFLRLIKILNENGRGKIFDILCNQLKLNNKDLVKKLIRVYRSHTPKINANKETIKILRHYSKFNKYIITDGNYFVQKKRLDLLK